MSQRTTKLTDRRPDDDVMSSISIELPVAQAEAESGAAVRVQRFVRIHSAKSLSASSSDRVGSAPAEAFSSRSILRSW